MKAQSVISVQRPVNTMWIHTQCHDYGEGQAGCCQPNRRFSLYHVKQFPQCWINMLCKFCCLSLFVFIKKREKSQGDKTPTRSIYGFRLHHVSPAHGVNWKCDRGIIDFQMSSICWGWLSNNAEIFRTDRRIENKKWTMWRDCLMGTSVFKSSEESTSACLMLY